MSELFKITLTNKDILKISYDTITKLKGVGSGYDIASAIYGGTILYQKKNLFVKRIKLNTKRRNIGDLYNGQLRVKVCRSSSLNRQITGWVRGINKYWGIV